MIALVIEYLPYVLPMVKIWHFSGKFDDHLSIVLWFRKNRNSRQGRDIGSCESLVSYNFQNLLPILAQFLQIYI